MQTATAAPVEPPLMTSGDRTPAYVLQAQSDSDVAHGVAFAREHHLRLRVKNTGHDYLGRSSDPGSFTIWTHALNETRFEPEFVPAGAPEGTTPHMALVVGAGTIVKGVYEAADKAGVIVAGGVSKTVGAGADLSLLERDCPRGLITFLLAPRRRWLRSRGRSRTFGALARPGGGQCAPIEFASSSFSS